MRKPMMSGHCANPATDNPTASHERCQRMGGGNRANPRKEYQPCPCSCHFADQEQYECECGGVLVEAPHWPQEDPDYKGEPVYTHLDKNGFALGEMCP